MPTEAKKTPKACINHECNIAGEPIWTSAIICPECREQIFPWEDCEFVEAEEAASHDSRPMARDSERDLSEWLFNKAVNEHLTGQSALPFAPIDTFTCPEDLTTCPVAPKASVEITIEMFNQWTYLARRFSTEWIAYLLGERSATDPNKVIISGMYFPKQKANGGHCSAEDREILPGTIGAVHSHVGMNVFFSNEDVAHFNHDIELVVNNRGEIRANGRTRLDCGRYHRAEARVILSGTDEMQKLGDELQSKISAESLSSTFVSVHPPTSVSIHPQTVIRHHGGAAEPERRFQESQTLAQGPFQN